ncbi:hypothetical protein AVEN_33034-1 [Araneus ventricosus]|uniref:Uncharacterized protein n=1 Tax=Araneus ventricosus TaxID=182803 RepID=A0A4Y2TZA9_ARAVE|nr:hypothetical protein AVEN_189841-1 [Araneus ventricosus]GBO06049.1 hypothetical protein AVEN_33034-1 [Araneus ventricosus]
MDSVIVSSERGCVKFGKLLCIFFTDRKPPPHAREKLMGSREKCRQQFVKEEKITHAEGSKSAAEFRTPIGRDVRFSGLILESGECLNKVRELLINGWWNEFL